MQVLLTLGSIGSGLGPSFTFNTNAGLPTPSFGTLSQLSIGLPITVPTGATNVTITSVGFCTNSITIPIGNIPPTTTTSTTRLTTTTTSRTTTSTTTIAPTTSTSTSTSTSSSTTSTSSTSSTSSTTSTSSSTSTTSSTSTSTTSTTTICCNQWDIEVLQSDLDQSTGNAIFPNGTVFIQFNDCRDNDPTIGLQSYTTPGIKVVCSCDVPNAFYYKNDSQELAMGSISSSGPSPTNCPKPTTTTSTTSTTTIPLGPCTCYTIENVTQSITGSWTGVDCNDQNTGGILNGGDMIYRCLKLISAPEFGPIEYMEIFPEDSGFVNCTCLPTTTSTSSTSSTTTSTTTCNCVEGREVIVSINGNTTGFIEATSCQGGDIFIEVTANVINTIEDCIVLGTIQGVGAVTIDAQTGGTPCC